MISARKLIGVTIASALAMSTLLTAAEAACTQNRAVYQDRDGLFTLTFVAEHKNALKMTPAPTNEFIITAKDKPEFKLAGSVIWPEEGIARPYGMITYNCKADSSDPDDLDECSVWQGAVYALKEGAEAETLPKADEPAALAILFPDLVTAMDGYDFAQAKPEKMLQWEAFRFQECTPDAQ